MRKGNNFFNCMDCHQDIVTNKKEVSNCPTCGGKYVIQIKPNVDSYNNCFTV